jgi:ACS family glucarate transporter-like MFS transporter
MQNLVGNLGSVASPAVTGWVVNATGSFQMAFVITAGVLVFGACVYVLVVRSLDPIRPARESGTSLAISPESRAESA